MYISSASYIWTDYENYRCDLSISAFDIRYQLSLTECQAACTNSTDCKGISWYEYLKQDVDNDPSRCYLLDKIYDLELFTLAPTTTSFWYNDISSDIECINYPYSWTDRYGDDCDIYENFAVCDNAFNDSSKEYIVNEPDSTYNLNAFQTCCSCAGSMYEYTTSNGIYY